MSLSQLVAADLEQTLPPLLRGAAVVALVPATDLRGWAAEMAWQVARAAASGGRRTALVDCFVDAPTLHGVSGAGNEEGLVDAFEYGASLNRIVQQQPQANLFFIPAGTFSSEAEQLMQNPRWRRLSAGFRHEEALLLLYVSADHLAGLAAEPDGLVVLAPTGLDLAVIDAPALIEAVGRGMTVLAVIADEEAIVRHSREIEAIPEERAPGHRGTEKAPGHRGTGAPTVSPAPVMPEPTAEPPAPPAPRRSEPSRRRSAPMMGLMIEAQAKRPNWLARIGIAGGIATLAAMVWYLGSDARPGGRPALTTAPPAAQPAAPDPVRAAVALPFTVQVASLARLADALALADTLEARGNPALVAPIRLSGREPLYRVHAGPFATASRADSALAALRAANLLAADAGARDSVPLSIALGTSQNRAAAVAERARLRAAGVPTFILGQGDGTFRLYAGAYDASAQATLLTDILTPTGGAGELVPRSGYVP